MDADDEQYYEMQLHSVYPLLLCFGQQHENWPYNSHIAGPVFDIQSGHQITLKLDEWVLLFRMPLSICPVGRPC